MRSSWYAAVAVALVASSIAQLASPSEQPVPAALDERELAQVDVAGAVDAPESIEALRRRIATILDREGVPGVGIALVGRDGPLWIGGVGVADLETQRPVTADTVFRIASITKMIVGLGVMRLVEQGKLSLDRPLRELMPEVAIDNAWDADAPVTLGQVLEHTAGLDDMRFNEVFTDDELLPVSAALAINPRSRTIRWRPGSRMSYSNVGYSLAARAIEVATGEPFDIWLRREVLAPIGMTDVDFRRTETLAPRLATGYLDRDRPARFQPIAHRAAGALLASPADLAKLVELHLRRGAPIVSPAGLARIERAGTLPFPHMDVEYGLGNGGDVGHASYARGHDGGLPGFLSALRYFPDRGVGYVMLLDATHSFAAYIEIRRLLFAYLARGASDVAALAREVDDAPRAEFYEFANPRHDLFAFLDRARHGWHPEPIPSGVRLEPLIGRPLDLVATKDGGYRFPGESGTSVRFATDRDGTPVLLAHGVYGEAAPRWFARLRIATLALALWLLELAPLWAAGVFAIAALRRRRVIAPGLVIWPAVACACLSAVPRLFLEAAMSGVLGEPHPLTVAITSATLGFALASCAALWNVVRWSRRPDRPSLARRIVPSACAIAAFGLAVWLGAHGVIGLTTWTW